MHPWLLPIGVRADLLSATKKPGLIRSGFFGHTGPPPKLAALCGPRQVGAFYQLRGLYTAVPSGSRDNSTLRPDNYSCLMGLPNQTFCDIQDIAWKRCEEQLGYPSGTFADDQSRRRLGDESKEVRLTLLKILEDMAHVIELSSFKAETDAIRSGAGFAEIAAYRGVSRQAVRQRRKRHLDALRTQKRKITLVGGPYGGDEKIVSDAAKAIRTPVSVYRQDIDDEWASVSYVARYVQSTGSDELFVFESIEKEPEAT